MRPRTLFLPACDPSPTNRNPRASAGGGAARGERAPTGQVARPGEGPMPRHAPPSLLFSPQSPPPTTPLTGKKIKFGQARSARQAEQTQRRRGVTRAPRSGCPHPCGVEQASYPPMSRHRSHGRLHSGFLIAFSCLSVKGRCLRAPSPPATLPGDAFRAAGRGRASRGFFLSLGSAKEVRGGALPPLRSNAHPLTKNACISYLYHVSYLY
jgi:hypothetical protein